MSGIENFTQLNPKQLNPKQLNPITLAFIGDGVYELLVREKVVSKGDKPAVSLHQESVSMARASFQGKAALFITPYLTEEEGDILRRGRNANNTKPPKNANCIEYRLATGLEALFGYLHLLNKQSRIRELFDLIYCEVER